MADGMYLREHFLKSLELHLTHKPVMMQVLQKHQYLSAVSALVKEEKITVAELKELIELVEKGEQK